MDLNHAHDHDLKSDLQFAILLLGEVGLTDTVPMTRERFARLTKSLPVDDVGISALMVSIHLALAHFDTNIATLLHEGLIQDEATLGDPELTEPVHIAATMLNGWLTEEHALLDAMTAAHPAEERARGCVILANILARSAAAKRHTSVEDLLTDLIASAP